MPEAFVTLATNDTYCIGCLVLAKSLRRTGTQRDIVAMISKDVTQSMIQAMRSCFDLVTEVDIMNFCDPVHLELLGRPELGVTLTKINCWTLTQYSKCVFLDADTLVVDNVDELFERDELSAAPDVGWPDCFNSGVFVFCPNEETFTALRDLALNCGSFDGGDQGLLNMYFSNWAHKDINRHLPFVYNVVSHAFYSYLPALLKFREGIKIVHFIGPVKPWHHLYDPESEKLTLMQGAAQDREFLLVWWDIYHKEIEPLFDSNLRSFVTSLPYVKGDEQVYPTEKKDYQMSHDFSAVQHQLDMAMQGGPSAEVRHQFPLESVPPHAQYESEGGSVPYESEYVPHSEYGTERESFPHTDYIQQPEPVIHPGGLSADIAVMTDDCWFSDISTQVNKEEIKAETKHHRKSVTPEPDGVSEKPVSATRPKTAPTHRASGKAPHGEKAEPDIEDLQRHVSTRVHVENPTRILTKVTADKNASAKLKVMSLTSATAKHVYMPNIGNPVPNDDDAKLMFEFHCLYTPKA